MSLVAYVAHHGALIGELTLQHIALVVVALLVALCFALPVGVLASRRRRVGGLVLPVLSVIYTIPSLALFALLIPWLGLGFWTAVVALAAYGQMILVRNTVAALASVDPAIVEAARGVGMQPAQLLWSVERPLAMPVFVAGVRITAVSLIGIATIAAWVNAGGLGVLVLGGIENDDPVKAVVGAVAAVALAFIADAVLRGVERRASRWRQT